MKTSVNTRRDPRMKSDRPNRTQLKVPPGQHMNMSLTLHTCRPRGSIARRGKCRLKPKHEVYHGGA